VLGGITPKREKIARFEVYATLLQKDPSDFRIAGYRSVQPPRGKEEPAEKGAE